jgi:hypothetical protein
VRRPSGRYPRGLNGTTLSSGTSEGGPSPLARTPVRYHSPLHFPEFFDDLDQVLDRALKAGFRGILVPIGGPSLEPRIQRHRREWGLWSAAGLHPNHLEELRRIVSRG